jgi:hypothetical protein
LNDQVLAFIKIIAPHLKNEIHICIGLLMEMKNLDEQQRGFMKQLLQIIRKNRRTDITVRLDNIPFMPDMDNKTRLIFLAVNADTDIPLLMKMLATPRPDGQQKVIGLYIENDQMPMKMVDAIKQVENFLNHYKINYNL